MGRAVILRALSVRQPWAFAITHLGKDYENRTRRLHYQGPLLIHTGKALVRADYEAACDEIEELTGRRRPAQPELGGIVGAALLVGCEEPPSEDVGWHQAGAFGLHLERATALPFRPCRGALGVFKVTLNRRELGLLREDGLIAQGSRARIRYEQESARRAAAAQVEHGASPTRGRDGRTRGQEKDRPIDVATGSFLKALKRQSFHGVMAAETDLVDVVATLKQVLCVKG